MTKKPTFHRVLRKALAGFGGYRGLGRIAGITHSTLRYLVVSTAAMDSAYAIKIEKGTKGAFDRIEFFPELLKGPLGKKLLAAAEKDETLRQELISRNLIA